MLDRIILSIVFSFLYLSLSSPHLIAEDKYYYEIISSSDEPSLEFFAVVTRHGSRSPLRTFPNDPYPYTDSQYWPNGPNELTNLGKVQLYHTGKYLRNRYKQFLDSLYHPNVTDVEYNPYNRDYMSAACLTAGLYPPAGAQIWDFQLPWQPIPQRRRNFDICDLAHNDKCPKFKKLATELSNKYDEDSGKHKELLDYVSSKTGAKYTKLSQLFFVYDTLTMQEENGYKLAEWTTKVFPTSLRPLAVPYLLQMYAGTKDLIKLGAGPELKYISDMLMKKANGTYTKNRKFYIEAAHDCTLLNLLTALGSKDPNLEIKTGAFVLFELYKQPQNYSVNVLYFRTSYDKKPEVMEIPGCKSPCALSNFVKFVDTMNPPDWTQACIDDRNSTR